MKAAILGGLLLAWAVIRSRQPKRNEWHDARWLAWSGSVTRVL